MKTALNKACLTNNLALVKKLANNVGKYECDDFFHIACNAGHTDIVNFFITGEYINIKDNIYPLITYVCKTGNIEIIESIFKIEYYKNNYSSKLIDESFYQGCKNIVDYIIKIGLNINWNRALTSACKGNNIELIDLCIKNGAIFNMCIKKNLIENDSKNIFRLVLYYQKNDFKNFLADYKIENFWHIDNYLFDYFISEKWIEYDPNDIICDRKDYLIKKISICRYATIGNRDLCYIIANYI